MCGAPGPWVACQGRAWLVGYVWVVARGPAWMVGLATLVSHLWPAGPVVQMSPQWVIGHVLVVGCGQWLLGNVWIAGHKRACDATSPGATVWVTGWPVRLVGHLVLERLVRGGWPRVPGGHAWPESPMPLGKARSGREPPPLPLEAISGICTSNQRTQLGNAGP